MREFSASAAIKASGAALWGVGLFSAFINVLVLTGSIYMLQVYDRVLPSRSIPTLIGITILLVILYVAYGALDFARLRILARIGLAIDRRLRRRVLDSVVSVVVHTKNRAEALQPVRDLDQIRSFMSGLGPTALYDIPWMPFYMGLIYFLHPTLGMFAVASAVALVSLTFLTELRTKESAKRAAASSTLRSNFGESARRNAEVVSAMGLGHRLSSRWEGVNQRYLSDQISMSDASGGIGTISKVLRMFLQSGILGLGAYLVILDELSAGALIAGSIILSRALAPIETAISNWKGFIGMRQGVKRLDALFATLPAGAAPIELPRPTQTLEIANLSVGPPGAPLPAISCVSFQLQAGDGLGVIGPSGAGKTTLLRAAIGVWKPLPRGGSVRLDGATIDQWPPDLIGNAIGYLPQEIQLFEGTLAENIARLDPMASDESVIAAAKAAGTHDMIVGLPEGYATQVGDGGVTLSAGQRQRIGLARALFGSPFLIVLDEPNSNLDKDGDTALIHAIRAARQRGAIVIVVTHRKQVLAALNKVLAMANGKAQAFGPRDEVLQKVLQSQGGSREQDEVGRHRGIGQERKMAARAVNGSPP